MEPIKFFMAGNDHIDLRLSAARNDIPENCSSALMPSM
jgi:hypothetical protein